MSTKFAIIVAGGSGSRMRAEVPKQFLEINGKAILLHTIDAFLPEVDQIVLVIPEKHQRKVTDLLKSNSSYHKVKVAIGGETRFHSVKNGLIEIGDRNGFVAIHDAVRPMIQRPIIRKSFESAENYTNGVVAMPLKDSIRQVNDSGNQAVDRSNYMIIQTPQTFQLDLLRNAFATPYNSTFTDDASVFEKAGHPIHLVEGDYKNIKITTPEDLVIAKTLIRNNT